ncbi:hypothetical protein KR018_012291, partial [Drosophila ironensis]
REMGRLLMAFLGLGLMALLQAAPLEVVYTGEGCACPTQLGYQLNVPNPPKPKKYAANDYGYRVEKPVQTKAKISYSFDFTVEQPRTPAPPKTNSAKLYAKVDRVTVNKGDCQAKNKATCGCASCSSQKSRYVAPSPPSASVATKSPNAIRRRRDLRQPGHLIRRRLMRQQQLEERPPRYVKLYRKDLSAVQPKYPQKVKLFGLLPVESPANSSKTKRKTKKAAAGFLAGFGRRLSKRDIKGEFDLLERDRSQIDLTAPEIIQFMPETLNPDFKPGQCHTGCGAITSAAPPPEDVPLQKDEPETQAKPDEEAETGTESSALHNSIPAKRSALSYFPLQIPSPLSLPLHHQQREEEYKYVDDAQLRSLLSTTSVPDPLEYSSTPLQFAGDLESVTRRSYGAPLLGLGAGYPVEHVSDSQLDSIISGIVYNHPGYQYSTEGALVDPEPVQRRQTTDFLNKLIGGRLGGWGFDAAPEPEHALRADYSTRPAKTYGYNSHTQNGYSVDTYNVPPITDYLRAWF